MRFEYESLVTRPYSEGIKAYCDGKLSKGDLVAINLQSIKAPVAVGTAWLSSEDMYMAAKYDVSGENVGLIDIMQEGEVCQYQTFLR